MERFRDSSYRRAYTLRSVGIFVNLLPHDMDDEQHSEHDAARAIA